MHYSVHETKVPGQKQGTIAGPPFIFVDGYALFSVGNKGLSLFKLLGHPPCINMIRSRPASTAT